MQALIAAVLIYHFTTSVWWWVWYGLAFIVWWMRGEY